MTQTNPWDAKPAAAPAPRTRLGWREFVWRYVAPLFFVLMIPFTATSLGPSWTAHNGGGTPGTFTATQHDCSGRSCTWRGDFVATDRSVNRIDVQLASGADDRISHVGDALATVDTGDPNNIYPVGGGSDWILVTLLFGVAVVALLVWALTVGRSFVRYLRQRRRRRARSTDLFDQLRQAP